MSKELPSMKITSENIISFVHRTYPDMSLLEVAATLCAASYYMSEMLCDETDREVLVGFLADVTVSVHEKREVIGGPMDYKPN